ncbi:hypothetical protein Tco_1269342 [Tanacetum coccineum]
MKKANTSLSIEHKKYKNTKYVQEAEFECEKAYDLIEDIKKKSERSPAATATQVHEIKQKFAKMEQKTFAHQRIISTMSSEKEELKKLANNVKIMILEKLLILRNSITKPRYLKKVKCEKPCLYDISFDKNDLANMFALETD